MNKYKLSPRQWIFVIGAAVGIIFLREVLPPAFYAIWNVLIIIYALLLSSFITAEKYYFFYAIGLASVGGGMHWIEVSRAIEKQVCSVKYQGHLFEYISSLDSCLNYGEPWVLGAQAMLLAGLGVIVISVISELHKLYIFFRHEF